MRWPFLFVFILLLSSIVYAPYIAPSDPQDDNSQRYISPSDSIDSRTPFSYEANPTKQAELELNFINWVQPSFKNITFLNDGNLLITPDFNNSTITFGISPNFNVADLNISDLNTLLDSIYSRLDGTNQPHTGDIEISKATPQLSLTNSNDTGFTFEIIYNDSGYMVVRKTSDIVVFGLTGYSVTTAAGRTGIRVTDDQVIDFRDTALKINSSADGQLDIDADAEVEITSPLISLVGTVKNPLDNSGYYTGALDEMRTFHDGSDSYIQNSTGALIIDNDYSSANTPGNLQFFGEYLSTATPASATASIYNSSIDLTPATSAGTLNLMGTKFASSFDNLSFTPAGFPSITYTGVEFDVDINGHDKTNRSAVYFLNSVKYDIDIDGNLFIGTGGMNINPYVIDIDLNASIIGSHTVVGSDVDVDYTGRSTDDQMGGTFAYRGITHYSSDGTAFVPLQTSVYVAKAEIDSPDNITVRYDSTYYEAVVPSSEANWNAALDTGQDLYLFSTKSGLANGWNSWAMADHTTAAFYSSLINDPMNYSFVSTGADWWAGSDDQKFWYGATKDASTSFDGTNFLITNEDDKSDYIRLVDFNGSIDGDWNVLKNTYLGSADGSYSKFDENGTLTLHGNAKVVRELIFKAGTATKGSSAPTDARRAIGASGGVEDPVISFSEITEQEIYGSFHPPNEIDNDTNISFHLMWLPADDWTSGDYVWCLEYIIKKEDAIYGDANTTSGTPTTICETVTPDNAVDYIETEYTQTIDVDFEENLIAHFYRDVANDDGDADGEVRFFEVEYTMNKLGETLP